MVLSESRFYFGLYCQQRTDVDGVQYAGKATIRCVFAKNLSKRWEVQQLLPELQEIVQKNGNHFNGDKPE